MTSHDSSSIVSLRFPFLCLCIKPKPLSAGVHKCMWRDECPSCMSSCKTWSLFHFRVYNTTQIYCMQMFQRARARARRIIRNQQMFKYRGTSGGWKVRKLWHRAGATPPSCWCVSKTRHSNASRSRERPTYQTAYPHPLG